MQYQLLKRDYNKNGTHPSGMWKKKIALKCFKGRGKIRGLHNECLNENGN